jgi:phospholipase C
MHKGELCSTLIAAINSTRVEGLQVSQFMTSATCAADAVVTVDPTIDANTLTSDEDGKDSYMLPFPLMFDSTSASCMSAPRMAYDCNIKMWNNGSVDGWNTARDPGYGMSYFNRSDLPYYYALGDAFTIGDQYFQSTFTATCPNREHLFAGSNGLSVPGSGMCLLDDAEPAGMTWETMGETLLKANVSWKLYQEADNFDDNGFQWFEAYKKAKPGSYLWDQGMARSKSFVDAFAQDVANDKLPAVSWLVGPARLSEHATNHPADGEDLSARILSILAKPENAKVYAKTAFILNYDEGGQFYDHHWPPTPPMDEEDGSSTVTTEGELTQKVEFGIPEGRPIGLGWRVPLFLISPWTRGDYVYSEVADHTSVLQFIEKRFNVTCPNISPWRRAVTGDLTAAFDFTKPDYSWPLFPSTSGNVNASKDQCDNNPSPTVPSTQRMPGQEAGTKLHRAIPSYTFDVSDTTVTAPKAAISITIRHVGAAGATAGVFNVYDRGAGLKRGPRKYTVEGGKSLTGTWDGRAYELHLHGPNGYVRQFKGGASSAGVAVVFTEASSDVAFALSVPAAGMKTTFTLTDNAYGAKPLTVAVGSGSTGHGAVSVAHSGSWYDVTVTSSAHQGFARRFMGHVEVAGTTTTSDPAMAKGTPGIAGPHPLEHPPMLERFTSLGQEAWKEQRSKECKGHRALFKDACWIGE